MFWKKKVIEQSASIIYCETCKYCKPFINSMATEDDKWNLAKCAFPDINLVSAKIYTLKFCGNERKSECSSSCGPDAKYYEPKSNQ